MNQIKEEWILWYHSINDNQWGKGSYQKIHEINNLYDYQYIHDIFKQDHYQNGMFFCMKEGIFPNWEDPDNRSGGCLSFKVTSIKVIDEWNTLLLKCITNQILNEHNEEINGIIIIPITRPAANALSDATVRPIPSPNPRTAGAIVRAAKKP